MTLIIGHRCNGGLVPAADRKIVRGGESDFQDKIFELGGVVLAFEGLPGIRDDFLILLESQLESARGFTDLYQAKLLIEDIVLNLSERYAERLGENAYVGAILGGLSGISGGQAELYYVHPQGYGESVRYRSSGHGAQYAHTLAKFLLTSDLSLEDSAYWTAFVISWVSENVDSTVGGQPQVAMIRDNVPGIEYLSHDAVSRSADDASAAQEHLAHLLKVARSETASSSR